MATNASLYTDQILAFQGGNIVDVDAANIDSRVDVDTRRVLSKDFPASTTTGLTYSCGFVGLLYGGRDWPGIEALLVQGNAPETGLFAVVRTKRDGALVWTDPGVVGRELSYEEGGYIRAAAQVRHSGRVYRCEAKRLGSTQQTVNVGGAAFLVASHDFAPSNASITVGSASVNVSAGMGVTQISGLTSGTASATYAPAAGSLWLLGGTEVGRG